MSVGGLYAIVDPDATGARDPEQVAQAILDGGCARMQLRFKSGGDRDHLDLARRIRVRCRAAGVPFVINDRPDLARLAEADGLHLGQDDLSIDEARKIVGGLEIGLSTHDAEQARAAERAGADLVAFGPVFATQSKRDPDPVVGLEALAAICAATSRPVVAIGGISAARADAVRGTGAAFGAAISAICAAADVEGAARSLHLALGGAS